MKYSYLFYCVRNCVFYDFQKEMSHDHDHQILGLRAERKKYARTAAEEKQKTCN